MSKKKAHAMIFNFVLIDHTTSATPDNLKPAPHFAKMIEALSEQIDGPYSTMWKGAASCGEGYSFRVGTVADRAKGEIAINFRDTIPEAPDALAYHQVTNGVPDIEVGVDLFSDVMDTQEGMLCGLSHEILETLGDPGANEWCDQQDSSRKMRAKELCDRVQNTGYKASNGGWVSNFLLPCAFIPGAEGPWDYLGKMSHQYDVSHGYDIVCGSPNDVQQIGGKHIDGEVKASHKKRKSHPFSRTSRRGIVWKEK